MCKEVFTSKIHLIPFSHKYFLFSFEPDLTRLADFSIFTRLNLRRFTETPFVRRTFQQFGSCRLANSSYVHVIALNTKLQFLLCQKLVNKLRNTLWSLTDLVVGRKNGENLENFFVVSKMIQTSWISFRSDVR